MYCEESFTPNMNVKLKHGGRKGMKMSMDEFVRRYRNFCEKIRDTQDYDDWWMTDEEADESVTYGNKHYKLPVILGDKYTDKFKVEFDMENYGLDCLGMASTGIPYLVAWYGGDWELPMVVFYYFDDKGKLRNYIPTKGNCFNVITKTAYGSENYADNFKELLKKYKYVENAETSPEEYLRNCGLRKGGIPVNLYNDEDNYDSYDEDNDNTNSDGYDYYNIERSISYNLGVCEEDFAARVTI